MYDMLKICPSQREALLRTLDHTKKTPTTNTQKSLAANVSAVEAMPTMFKDKIEVPPFLLSIWIYGRNLHNYLIDSRASYNVMPLSISQMLGAIPQPTSRVVIQLDKIEVKVIDVLKDVRIQLTTDPRIQDIIDIHVINIPKMYGMLLSREWTKCLRGWFSMDFTQLWLAWKGLNNQIKIDAEPKLKAMITEYNAPNEILFN